MFSKRKENEHLKIENKILNDEIKELKKELKKYKEDRDNTLSGLLKDFDYAIIVDKGRTKLFNAGRWENFIRKIQFVCELPEEYYPTLTIER